MRQLRLNKRELVLRCSNLGRHHLAGNVATLARLGALSLAIVVWLGYRQAPVLWIALVAVGILLILIDPFVPHLYPEVATCIFNKGFNRLTVIHEILRGRRRQRRVNHYRLSHIKHIQVYRQRIGLWRWGYILVIQLSSPANTVIHINGISDQVLLQTGRHPIRLLSKTVRYQLGRRTAVDWSFVTVPHSINTANIGRRIVVRKSVERLDNVDLRRLAHTLEQFIGSP